MSHWRGQFILLNPIIQMQISSGNALIDTFRMVFNLGTLWPVTLTHKTNHHRYHHSPSLSVLSFSSSLWSTSAHLHGLSDRINYSLISEVSKAWSHNFSGLASAFVLLLSGLGGGFRSKSSVNHLDTKSICLWPYCATPALSVADGQS